MAFRRRLLLAALLTTAALAGCSGGGNGIFGAADTVQPNAIDAAFVRAMVAHERNTGSIARIGSRKALREELRRIANETLGRNDRDLRLLAKLADDLRGRGVSPGGARIQEPPPSDPRGLRAAVSIDHEFLVRMIRQHEYAVAVAAAERDRGGDKRLKALARTIHDSRRRDLATLRRWLRTWYGGPTQPPPGPRPGGGGGGGGGPSTGPPV